jgi:AcrR family transcriptional regulator
MSEAWHRVAQVASDRFLAEGYAGVSLRALGDALGMKPASLYHHCPGGKSELFVRAVTWRLDRVSAEVRRAGVGAPDLEAAFGAMADALLDAPLVDLQRLMSVDLQRLRSETDRAAVSEAAHAALLGPFAEAVAAAQASRAARPEPAAGLVAAAAVAIVTNLGQLHLSLAGADARPAISAQVRAALGLLARGLAPH